MIPTPTPAWWPEHLEVADSTVEVSELVLPLRDFLIAAAGVHWNKNGLALTITSGNDGNHFAGSKHFTWRAVDLRSRDLEAEEADDFACELILLQRPYLVGVFDERFLGRAHWHVETA